MLSDPKPSASWGNCDAFLFDIDGTILHTRDLVHYNALNRAMRDVYGKDTTIDGVQYHGMTDLGILRAALSRMGVSEEEFEQKLPQALEYVREDVSKNIAWFDPQICDSIPAVLAWLQDAGKLLGVASGNLESVGWHKLEAAGLRPFFSFGVFSDDHEQRTQIFAKGVEHVKKQLGEKASVCFVGDTPQDIHAARAAGARIISVCTGIYRHEDLHSLEPDFCVASCSDLLQSLPSPHS